jgi:hypothetical protein
MPPENREPEKYSIDEMMERLKGKPSENPAEGQLVTREDGTQAIRVRKRKRRSEQPKREEAKRQKRIRIIQVSAALILLMLCALVIGGAFVYTNTPTYRKAVSNSVAEALGGTVEFKMFRVTPVSANADAIDVTWPDGNGFQSLKLRGISSKISPFSLLSSSLKGEEVVAREGEVFFGPGQPAESASSASPSGMPIRFNRMSVTKLNLTAGDPVTPALKLSSSEVTVHVDEGKTTSSLRIHRGTLAIAKWPVFKVDRALVQLRPDAAELVGLRIHDSMTPRGTLDLSGTLHPFDPSQSSSLTTKLENFNLADLLGPDLGKLLDARIDSIQDSNDNKLTFRSDSPDSIDLVVGFRNSLNSRVEMSGFPFLLSLSRTLGDQWYVQPSLEESEGKIVRKGSTLELRDLDFLRKTHMAIKGNLTITADQSLSGTLEIGIPEPVVQLSPNLKTEALFGPVREGFRWLSLTIGGTTARPTDNFSELYGNAKEAAQADPLQPREPSQPAPSDEVDPGKAFEDLTTPRER